MQCIDATLFKAFRYQTRLSNSLFHNANENRVKLDYNTPKLRFELGDRNLFHVLDSIYRTMVNDYGQLMLGKATLLDPSQIRSDGAPSRSA